MIIDIVLIVILLLGALIGYKRGFVKVIVKLGTFALAIALAFILQSSVAVFVGKSLGLENSINIAVEEKLVKFTKTEEKEGQNNVNIPILEKTIEEINQASVDKKTEIISDWSSKITDFVIKGISFMLIFIVVSILMGIIGLILDTVCKLPVLKTLNGTLGASTEVLLMVFRILILLAIISFLSPLEILNSVTKYINESCITKWLYENNIIISILGRKLL